MNTEDTKFDARKFRASLRKEARAINERNRVPGDPHYKEPKAQPESELDKTERRLMEVCADLQSQTEATMAEVRKANQALPEIRRALQV